MPRLSFFMGLPGLEKELRTRDPKPLVFRGLARVEVSPRRRHASATSAAYMQ
jgi:hypothetical protein